MWYDDYTSKEQNSVNNFIRSLESYWLDGGKDPVMFMRILDRLIEEVIKMERDRVRSDKDPD